MFIRPSARSVPAGDVTVTVVNSGGMQHEVVFLKTDTAPTGLTVTKNRVSEADAKGEVGDIATRTTKAKVLHLTKGHYVLVCNIAGHYQAGMRAGLNVT
jgi:uncharacterized cupredoxin-like copper-binding protein